MLAGVFGFCAFSAFVDCDPQCGSFFGLLFLFLHVVSVLFVVLLLPCLPFGFFVLAIVRIVTALLVWDW